MTDKNAPERIWAWPQKDAGWRWPGASKFPHQMGDQYIRADLCPTPDELRQVWEALNHLLKAGKACRRSGRALSAGMRAALILAKYTARPQTRPADGEVGVFGIVGPLVAGRAKSKRFGEAR